MSLSPACSPSSTTERSACSRLLQQPWIAQQDDEQNVQQTQSQIPPERVHVANQTEALHRDAARLLARLLACSIASCAVCSLLAGVRPSWNGCASALVQGSSDKDPLEKQPTSLTVDECLRPAGRLLNAGGRSARLASEVGLDGAEASPSGRRSAHTSVE